MAVVRVSRKHSCVNSLRSSTKFCPKLSRWANLITDTRNVMGNSSSLNSTVIKATFAEQIDALAERKKRNRGIFRAASWGLLARSGSLMITIVSIPLAIDALGDLRFGIWVTITMTIAMFGFLDGGIGNALINVVADCNANRDDKGMRIYVSNAYFGLSAIALLGCVATTLVGTLINWRSAILLPDSIPEAEVAWAFIFVGIVFFANMPLSLSSRIFLGLQRTDLNCRFDIISYSVTLCATFVAWFCHAGLSIFLLTYLSGSVVANLVSTTIIMRETRFRPVWNDWSFHCMRVLFGTGTIYLGLQFLAAIAFQTDTLIVANLIGLSGAAEFGVASRMFMMITSLTGLITTPLWPAFRDARTRGDGQWVTRTLSIALAGSLIVSSISTCTIYANADSLLALWTNNVVVPSAPLMFACLLWANTLVIGNIVSILMNGLGLIRLQLLLGTIMTLINLPLSIYLTFQMGTSGVVYGSVVSYIAAVLIPCLFLLPRKIRSACLLSTSE